VLIVLKSGSLNLLEPSGPVQACNGMALSCENPTGRMRVFARYDDLTVASLRIRVFFG